MRYRIGDAVSVLDDEPTGSVDVVHLDDAWARIDGLTETGCTVVEPCAGTAPACIATKQLYGDDENCLAIDIKPDAIDAFQRRAMEEV